MSTKPDGGPAFPAIAREWEPQHGNPGTRIGFGVNLLWQPSRNCAWYVSYQPTCPDSMTDETALIFYDSHSGHVLYGDHRKAVEEAWKSGGNEAVIKFFEEYKGDRWS